VLQSYIYHSAAKPTCKIIIISTVRKTFSTCRSTRTCTFLSHTNHLPPPLTGTISMQTGNIRVRNIHASHLASPIKLSCPHCDRTFSSIRGRKQHLRAIHPMPTRNTGAGSVLPDHESGPSPPNSTRSQTSSRPLSPSPLVGVPSPMGSNSPAGSSASLSHSESEREQHHDIPGTPITHNYHATVEDVTDDENESDSESEYDPTAFRRSPSSHHHSDIHPHFGRGPSNQRSSPSRDNSSLHTPEPEITRTYHPDLTGKFLSTLSFYLIQRGSRSALR
jgi:hypothetical protein